MTVYYVDVKGTCGDMQQSADWDIPLLLYICSIKLAESHAAEHESCVSATGKCSCLLARALSGQLANHVAPL